MNPITHMLIGWTVAESAALSRRDRALVTGAALIPDLDGAGILLDLASGHSPAAGAYGTYHHIIGHNLVAALLCALIAIALAKRRAMCAALVFVSFHLHLLGDLVGSAGPGRSIWSITYLYPFSQQTFAWSGQWELNAWPNIAITAMLLVWIAVLAIRHGRTPLELISRRADLTLVATLRDRFGR